MLSEQNLALVVNYVRDQPGDKGFRIAYLVKHAWPDVVRGIVRDFQATLAARGESQKQFPWRMFRRKIALWRWERGVASRKNSGLQLAPWRALPAIRFMSG